MKGFQIFFHALRMVFGNVVPVIKITLIPTLLMNAVIFGLNMKRLYFSVPPEANPSSGPTPINLLVEDMNGTFWFSITASLLIMVATWLWMAVGWHRFILLEEKPTILPKLHLGRMLGYFGYSILIAVILFIAAVILGIVVQAIVLGLLSPLNTVVAAVVATIAIHVPLSLLFYRLSMVLPGVAAAEFVEFGDGWTTTRDDIWAIIVLSIVSSVACYVFLEVGGVMFSAGGIITFAWSILSEWVIFVVGLSILTTLYGHYIQKRPLS